VSELPDQADPDFAELSARVYRLCLAMLGNEVDARDAAQESFARAWSQRRRKRDTVSWWTWLGGFAVRVCREARRRSSLSLSVVEALPEPRAASSVRETGQADQPVTAALREAVMSLPDRQREVTVLRLLIGLSTQETAQMLGCPPGTVKSNLFKAVVNLKAQVFCSEKVDELHGV